MTTKKYKCNEETFNRAKSLIKQINILLQDINDDIGVSQLYCFVEECIKEGFRTEEALQIMIDGGIKNLSILKQAQLMKAQIEKTEKEEETEEDSDIPKYLN